MKRYYLNGVEITQKKARGLCLKLALEMLGATALIAVCLFAYTH